jgi:hypothetical protein
VVLDGGSRIAREFVGIGSELIRILPRKVRRLPSPEEVRAAVFR